MRRTLVIRALGAVALLLVVCDRTDPTYYVDGTRHPAVCDDAAKAFEGQALSFADRYQLRFAPVVDVETCGAAGMLHGEWQVRFGLANVEDVQPYRSATLFGFDPSSDAPSPFSLSRDPWPAT